MRRGPVRLACVCALLTLALASTAQARQSPRIINGEPASSGEYPSQGFVEFDVPGPPPVGGTFICGGSLVSNRFFVTAAHCATPGGSEDELAPSAFRVYLGKVDRAQFNETSDRYAVTRNQVNELYDADTFANDVAVLTLDRTAPANLEPLRLIEEGETPLWAAGRLATVIGWGVTESGSTSRLLLEANVGMVSDMGCAAVWGPNFDAESMVCAGGGTTDTCGGDSGGPLMVSDGGFLVLAGLTSWGATQCGEQGTPGVYTRLGIPSLNDWVRDRIPFARIARSVANPETGQEVSFTATASRPAEVPAFTDFAWNFGDGSPVQHGTAVSHHYTAPGAYTARLTATGSGADTAVTKVRMNVSTPPPPPPPVVIPPPVVQRPSGPVARISSGRPKVRGGRFRIRVSFRSDAPRGTAVITVLRGKRKVGSARTRVVPGGSKRVTVKLNKTGRRLLKRAKSQRLKVRIRVRVGSRTLRTSTLTIRR
jgi:secreted trypsin-like serine protease